MDVPFDEDVLTGAQVQRADLCVGALKQLGSCIFADKKNCTYITIIVRPTATLQLQKHLLQPFVFRFDEWTDMGALLSVKIHTKECAQITIHFMELLNSQCTSTQLQSKVAFY